MKIRTCFVSNSSSSSFVVQGTDVEDIKNRIAKAIDSCPQLKGLGMKVVNSDSVLRLYPITDDLKAADRRRICRDIQEYTWWRFRPSELKTGTTRILCPLAMMAALPCIGRFRKSKKENMTWKK